MTWEFMQHTMAPGGMAAFMHAIMGSMAIMVIPPFFICSGIAWMAWKRRNTFAPDR